MTLLDPKLVAAAKADPLLDHDGRVSVLATALILEEGGQLAETLTSLPEPAEHDDPLKLYEVLEQQRGFLRATLAWTVAELALEGA